MGSKGKMTEKSLKNSPDGIRKIEILAPAGSKEALTAAANAGCDAAYIGGSMFGARAYADNLTKNDMLEAIDYMHIKDKKLYLTVNTLLKDDEIGEKLYDYLVDFYEHGLDAVIVQDIGVMKFIHENFPKMDIHASTQMTLTMAQGAKALENYGITRMVTSRELSFEEVKRIRKNTDLEIEAFVHGALCYCYSGQCLMSSMIGGRSGNRGRCAQPCRMEYSIPESTKRADGNYLLSPKDMCTLDRVADLIESGIDSFKIEGRMKRYEYSAGVTAAYRKQVDLYNSLGPEDYRKYIKKHPEELESEVTALKDLYNRGDFTNGYYVMHNSKSMMSMERPNHSGVYAGEVVSVSKNSAAIKLETKINAQDVLEFRKNGKSLYDYTVKEGADKGNIITARFLPGSGIREGVSVFRTKNNSLLEKLSKEYFENESKLPITGEFFAGENEKITLKVKRGSFEYTAEGKAAERAKNQAADRQSVAEKLKKTNNTPFYFEKLDINLNGDLFIPVGALNTIRREAIDGLTELIKKSYAREKGTENDCAEGSSAENNTVGGCCVKNVSKEDENRQKNSMNKPKVLNSQPKIAVSVINKSQLIAAAETEVPDEIYLDTADLNEDEIKECVKLCADFDIPVFLLLPHIFRADTYDKFIKMSTVLNMPGIAGYVIKNYEEYLFLTEGGYSDNREIRCDYNMYSMNRYAKEAFKEMGIDLLTAPAELNYNELKALDISDMELIVYGRIPLMVSAQCVRKNTDSCIKNVEWNTRSKMIQSGISICDRMNKNMRIMTHCNYCYNTIYNSEIFSITECSEIRELNPHSVRFIFSFESSEEIRNILKNYDYNNPSRVLCTGNYTFTKGHFNRGVE